MSNNPSSNINKKRFLAVLAILLVGGYLLLSQTERRQSITPPQDTASMCGQASNSFEDETACRLKRSEIMGAKVNEPAEKPNLAAKFKFLKLSTAKPVDVEITQQKSSLILVRQENYQFEQCFDVSLNSRFLKDMLEVVPLRAKTFIGCVVSGRGEVIGYYSDDWTDKEAVEQLKHLQEIRSRVKPEP